VTTHILRMISYGSTQIPGPLLGQTVFAYVPVVDTWCHYAQNLTIEAQPVYHKFVTSPTLTDCLACKQNYLTHLEQQNT